MIKVLFIAHDAYRAGGTIFLLNMVRWLLANTDLKIDVAMRERGEMEELFAALCPTHVLTNPRQAARSWYALVKSALKGEWTGRDRSVRSLQDLLRAGGYDLLYLNTITLGDQMEGLELGRTRVLMHVHELPSAIRRYGRGREALVMERADRVVCVSNAVRRGLAAMFPQHADKIERIYGFVPVAVQPTENKAVRRARLLEPLGIRGTALVVGFCGHGDLRKGVDLAVPLARLIPAQIDGCPVHFVWLGAATPEYSRAFAEDDVRRSGLGARMHFVGVSTHPADWLSVFDVHVLLSREDPFPLVVMEAAVHGVPTVCFDEGGGAPEFVRDDAGIVTPYLDLAATAKAVERLLADEELRRACGAVAQRRVVEEHAPEVILPRIVESIVLTIASAADQRPVSV